MTVGLPSAGLLARIAIVIEKGRATLASEHDTRTGSYVREDLAQGFRSSGLSLISSMYEERHHYYKDFKRLAVGYQATSYAQALAVMEVIQEEVHYGWFESTRALIAGELFDDFLEMAKHLLDEGYKDPAAVVAGSSLEVHLRRLCAKHQLDTKKPDGHSKKAETLNAELQRAKAYELSEQKQVTAWLGIRNDAAHGHYEKVIAGSVDLMIQGIRHFMTVRPA